MLNPEFLEGFSTPRRLSYELLLKGATIDKTGDFTKNILSASAKCGTN